MLECLLGERVESQVVLLPLWLADGGLKLSASHAEIESELELLLAAPASVTACLLILSRLLSSTPTEGGQRLFCVDFVCVL